SDLGPVRESRLDAVDAGLGGVGHAQLHVRSGRDRRLLDVVAGRRHRNVRQELVAVGVDRRDGRGDVLEVGRSVVTGQGAAVRQQEQHLAVADGVVGTGLGHHNVVVVGGEDVSSGERTEGEGRYGRRRYGRCRLDWLTESMRQSVVHGLVWRSTLSPILYHVAAATVLAAVWVIVPLEKPSWS